MTKEEFEQARIILERIKSLDKLISVLTDFDYKCEPPIRSTSWHLVKAIGSSNPDIELNEGEVVAIINTLRAERNILEYEFGRL